MKHQENNATSNAEKGEMVDNTEEDAHEIQMQAHSKNTSAMPTYNLTNIPFDLQGEIAGFLSVKELMRLIISSKDLFNDSKLIKTMIRKINESNAIKQLVAGYWHTLALTKEGRVLAWSKNHVGQLGLGHHNNQNTPQLISDLNNVAQLVAGARHSFALTKEGRVLAWGWNDDGQLGLGHNNNQNTPQRIEGLNNVAQLVAGFKHTLALTQEGRVWAWGWNRDGQLGLGHNHHQNYIPKPIPDLNNVAQIVAGGYHSLALTQEGHVWAWGLNSSGQLGLGNNDDQNTPQWIEGLNNVSQLVAGSNHTLALTQEGCVLAWGYNLRGQLGLGHINNQNTPGRIEGLNNVVQLASGGGNTLALTQEGRVWAWGYNDYGQLGLGHNNHQNTPSRVNMMPSSIQALLQYLEDHCRKISAQSGGKAVNLGHGYDNGDAKESSSSYSTPASSAALFSSGHQSRASVMEGARSTEGNGLNCTIL